MNAWRLSVNGLRTVTELELKQRIRSRRWILALVVWFLVIGGITSLVIFATSRTLDSDQNAPNPGPMAFALNVFFGEVEARGDLGVGLPAGEQLEYLPLTVGEGGEAGVLRPGGFRSHGDVGQQPSGGRRCDHRVPRMDGADAAQQIGRGAFFGRKPEAPQRMAVSRYSSRS